MSYLRRVENALALIREHGRYREVEPQEPRYVADFSTNDYLALAADSRMVEAMRHVKRVGSGGARLLGGRHREHWLLEADIARWLGRERALLFSSGYLAALGAIQVLAQFADTIYSDSLNHACLIDGIRGTKAPREVYSHAHLPPRGERRGRSLIVSETLFGMDGDTVDVAAIVAQLGDDDILLIDEAHALGVLGPEGAGLAHGISDERIVVLGTLGKAIGASGGFIAGPAALIDLLVNAARTFIFDTAPPPAIAFAARVGIMLARTADDRRGRLFAKTARLRAGLRVLNIPTTTNADRPQFVEGPIVPIVVGEEQRAMELMQRCMERGVYAPAVRPPTVPRGTSRLRVSMRADHTDEQVDLLLDALACVATS
jgi:8-amino-7-oxononanoate synthase